MPRHIPAFLALLTTGLLIAPAPALPEEPRTFAGVVRGPGGSPIAGAGVLALKPEFDKPAERPRRDEGGSEDASPASAATHPPSSPPPVAAGKAPEPQGAPPQDPFLRATTSPEGGFVLEVPAGPATFRLLVVAPGYETLYLEAAGPDDEPLELTLAPASRLHGTIVALESSAPLAGAEVRILRDRNPAGAGSDPKAGEKIPLPPQPVLDVLLPTARTDARGQWTADGLTPGLYGLQVRAPGRRPYRESEIPLRAREHRRFDVSLALASTLAGKVTGADGKPLAGARVSLEPDLGDILRGGIRNALSLRANPPRLRARTGSDGTYRFEELEAGWKMTARATREGYAPASREVTAPPAGETRTADFRLTAGARMTGMVADENGQPVPDALVELDPPGEGEEEGDVVAGGPGMVMRFAARAGRRMAARRENAERDERREERTDPGGRFDLSHLAPGEYEVRVHAAGKSRETGQRVLLEEGKTLADQRFTVELGKPLAGRVVDEQQQPVPEATLNAFSFLTGAPEFLETEADAEGRFEFRGVPGETCRLSASATGFAPSELEDVPTGSTGIEIVLRKTGAISGRVLLDTGETPATITVDPSPAASEERRGGGPMRVVLRDGRGGTTSIETDNGSYTFEGIREGTWNLTIGAPGFLRETVEDVKVVSGQTTPEVNVTLRRGGTIAGTVVRKSDGRPVEGADISLQSGGMFGRLRIGAQGAAGPSARSDLDGRFRLEGLAPGPNSLVASHPDFADAVLEGVEVKPAGEETSVQISLGKGGTLEGTVTDADGRPEGGVVVSVSNLAAGYLNSATTDVSGQYRVEGLPAGSYSVVRTPVGRRMAAGMDSRSATVREGETTRVDFRQDPGRITGRVIRGGSPVPGAGLTLMRDGGGGGIGSIVEGRTDSEGRYEIRGVSPGSYRASVSEDAGRPFGLGGVTVPLVIPEVEVFEHDIVLPEIYVTGRVVEGATGEPVQGAFVIAESRQAAAASGGGPRAMREGFGTGMSDAQGNFRVQLSQGGGYTLTASRSNYPPSKPVEITVGEEGASDVVITLVAGGRITGRVYDAAGRPVSQALILTLGGGIGGNSFTDEAGRFVLEVPEGRSPDLAVLSRNRAPQVLPSVRPGGEELQVLLTPGGSLEVQVNAPPALRAKMRLQVLDSRGQDHVPLLSMGMIGGIEDDLPGTGAVRIRNLAPGGYSIVLRAGDQTGTATAVIDEGQKATVLVAF